MCTNKNNKDKVHFLWYIFLKIHFLRFKPTLGFYIFYDISQPWVGLYQKQCRDVYIFYDISQPWVGLYQKQCRDVTLVVAAV
jgi:hypothetical protein